MNNRRERAAGAGGLPLLETKVTERSSGGSHLWGKARGSPVFTVKSTGLTVQ